MGARILRPVFSARVEGSAETFWLTVVDASFTPTSIDVSRFMAGANTLAALRHPTLVRIVIVDREIDFCVVGYEALPGAESLASVVARGDAHTHLPRVALEVARGLAFLHRKGVTHGSLTAAAVLLWEDVPLLWQYGLAGLCVPDVFGPRAAQERGDAVAPEVADGDPVSPAADVYAWGALIAELAVGPGPDMIRKFRTQDIAPTVPPRLVALARRALQPAVKARPADGEKLLEAIHETLADADGDRPPPWVRAVGSSADGLQRLAATYLEEVSKIEAAMPAAIPDDIVATPSGRLKIVERHRSSERADPRLAGEEVAPPKAAPTPPPAPSAAPEPAEIDDADILEEEGSSSATDLSHMALLDEPVAEAPDLLELAHVQAPVAAAPRRNPEADLDVALGDLSAPGSLDHGEYQAALPPKKPGAKDDPAPPPKRDDAITGRSKKVAAYVPPRLPGPHGPPPGRMAWALVALCGIVTAGATFGAWSAGATIPGLPGDSDDDASDETAARGDGGAGAESGDGADSSADVGESGAASPGPTMTDACPAATARLPTPQGEPLSTVCIEEAERPGFMERPTSGLSHEAARAVCEAEGRRLCTAAEWKVACGGVGKRAFPYGKQEAPGRCRADLRTDDPQTGPSGGRSRCITPEGVFDLVGNVAEYVEGGKLLGGSVLTPHPSCATASTPKAGSTPADAGVRCCVDVAVR